MDLYQKIKAQRLTFSAPVDTMGCALAGKGLDEETRRFQILVALLLSSQTKDETTFAAVQTLSSRLGTLTPASVCAAPPELVHSCIEKVGYHNKKLGFLVEISRRLNGNADAGGFLAPATLEDVLSLPGIGEKMAYLYMQHACGTTCGIGVDTHVHRISRRIGLTSSSSPRGTRLELERMFRAEEWPEINAVLVGFGQKICHSVRPRCGECSIKDECPSSTRR